MSTADGRYTIVFNGEIYNYLELKGMLERGKGGAGERSEKSSVISHQSSVGNEEGEEDGGRESAVISHQSSVGNEEGEEDGRRESAVSSLQSSVGNEEGVGGEEEVGSRQLAVGKSGNRFRSHSDTEVLLYLYAEYGEECLKLLRGMFSFVIWDEKEKTIFGARDRFGIKPFYYLHNKNEFIFSSELKAIKYYKNNLTISMKAVDAFLRTGSVPSPLTIYSETSSLEPGTYIKVTCDGNLQTVKWWSFEDLVKNNGKKKEYNSDAKAEIKEALRDAVKVHCIADVEVGAFLSGGIDSTAIVSLMKQNGYNKIKTISISFPGNRLDEAKYAQTAADKYFTAHYEYNLEENEVVDRMYDLIGMMDQPTIDGVNTYFISRAAKDFGLKVVMSGLGGDELFGGYPSFRKVPNIDRILKFANAIPFGRQLFLGGAGILKHKLPAKAIDLMRNPKKQNAGYKLIRGLFTDNELTELGFDVENDSSNDSIYNIESKGLSALQKISQFESVFYMGNMLLRDSDIFSMLNSLELRVPFVDHKLYEVVYPYIDSSFDFKYPKRMLVEGTGDLPNDLVFRPKMGFTFPFADWIKSGNLGRIMKEGLLDGQLKYFDKKGIENLFKLIESGQTHWSRIWAVNVVEKFQ
jgi:asparagine synthase (glutamine-hydrolysing)